MFPQSYGSQTTHFQCLNTFTQANIFVIIQQCEIHHNKIWFGTAFDVVLNLTEKQPIVFTHCWPSAGA
jgi:hypothetical protein